MQPMRRLNMHSQWALFFHFGDEVKEVFFGFFIFILNMFPSSSLEVLQVPKLLLKAFPLAPQFYLIWFAWSSSVIYINWMVGYTGCYYFALGSPKRCFHWGNAQCSKKTHWWANEYDSFKKPEAEFFESSWQNQNQSSLILKVFPFKKKETRDSLILKLFKKPEPEAIKKQPPNTGTNHG